MAASGTILSFFVPAEICIICQIYLVTRACQYFNKHIDFVIGYFGEIFYPGTSENVLQFFEEIVLI
jgi:hypothetical protein